MMMRPSHTSRIFATVLMGVVIPATSSTRGVPAEDLDRALAAEPAAVTTPGGRVFRGLLDGWRDGRLHLRVAADGGEVGYSFAREEMVRLDLPGADLEAQGLDLWERGETALALPLLEAITRQRLRYLPLLTAAQRRPLVACVEACGAGGDAWVVIGYVNRLRPHATDTSEEEVLRDALLLAHFRLGLKDETRTLAIEWCRAERPRGRSVLGWAILARLAFDDADYERALWVALEPIAFASPTAPEHLDTCYTLAVSAARKLGRAPHAELLLHEMLERGMTWDSGAAPAAAEPPDDGAAQPVTRPETIDPTTSTRTLEAVRKQVGVSP